MTTTPEDIAIAAKILREGSLVAFPTETVYGLGADASNEAALAKIFTAKERPHDHPLIVHIANIKQINDWAAELPPAAEKLAKAFWPGPLTMILKKRPEVLDILTGGQATVGIRIPKHPVAQALLDLFGKGVAAPSANKFTRISPTTAAAVKEELGEAVDKILDGGACEVGLESTIIDLSGETPVVLRPGMISVEAISKVLGTIVSINRQDAPNVLAPGMHHLHYAPRTPTEIVTTENIAARLQTLKSEDEPAVVVTYTNTAFPKHTNVFWVNMLPQPAAYAHDLYRTLRSLDQQHYQRIFVEAVPSSPEWDAVRDRLQKAGSST